jgi:ABC-type glucose/galactose transport system permease subunit|tara:strand:+ start:6764 stop:6988 length:225 start_codon:yes stop_codon:yes gene_type:complete
MKEILNTENLSRTRKACVYLGFGLLTLSSILVVSTLVGIFELNSFAILGHSGVRTLAGIAVAGCLLAAIGFYDE